MTAEVVVRAAAGDRSFLVTPQFNGCGANETPRRRALLVAPDIATRLTQAHPLTKRL